ncbi:KR domain-containing protein [Streptomyces sp. wa22]|uniref:KR domain-containing protein n=1 Tax=Streptomyces sp. wa22 TaxID=1828244 RepID=UPI00396746BC
MPAAPLNPEGTVLVTGGTGSLGRLLARHLAEHHGVRRFSRSCRVRRRGCRRARRPWPPPAPSPRYRRPFRGRAAAPSRPSGR